MGKKIAKLIKEMIICQERQNSIQIKTDKKSIVF